METVLSTGVLERDGCSKAEVALGWTCGYKRLKDGPPGLFTRDDGDLSEALTGSTRDSMMISNKEKV